MKQKILELRAIGYSYNEIASALGCAKSTVCYYLGREQANKNKLRQRNMRSKNHPFQRKIEKFNDSKSGTVRHHWKSSNVKLLMYKIYDFNASGGQTGMVTLQEVYDRYPGEVRCYLTGDIIDITEPKTYHFDHKVPVSRGGANTIDNLGICTKQANQAKTDMTESEFINFCKKVLVHRGHEIS